MRYLRPCHEPSCGELTESTYCAAHTHVQRNFRSSSKMGYDHQWRAYRKGFIERHPLCVECGMLGNTVDHIKPHKGDKALFWDVRNHQTMCHSCHSRKTATEDMGGWSNELGKV